MKGDHAIFSRLVEKVEEINRTTRSGESVLKLYDAEREEEFIAVEGLLAGNTSILDPPDGRASEPATVEEMLRRATEEAMADLAHLFDDDDATSSGTVEEQKTRDTSRIRLYDNVRFLEDGFTLLNEQTGDATYHPIERTAKQFILTSLGSVRGALRNGCPYRESVIWARKGQGWCDALQIIWRRILLTVLDLV